MYSRLYVSASCGSRLFYVDERRESEGRGEHAAPAHTCCT